jgi:GT2 family glycosyltransferase
MGNLRKPRMAPPVNGLATPKEGFLKVMSRLLPAHLEKPAVECSQSKSGDRPLAKAQHTRNAIRNLARRIGRSGQKALGRVFTLAKAAHHFARTKGGWRSPYVALKRSYELLQTGGIQGLAKQLTLYFYQVSRTSSYRIPLSAQLTPDQAAIVHRLLEHNPLVSLVIPVYKVEPRWLDLCLRSVAAQYYENWEAVLVDDGSHQTKLTRLISDWQSRDSRIRVIRLETNRNISAATNAGIEIAKGEYIGFVDHDDELTPDALTWFIASINEHPEAKWLYSDEAVISPQGKYLNLHLKPDYSPEFLLSAMYTCHLSLYAAYLVRDVGGMRIGFEGAQDHDLALRISERIHRTEVVHIPRVLYKWRAIETSTAANGNIKPQALSAGQKAVTEALARRGIRGTVTPSIHCSSMYEIALEPKFYPRVSIIIPTRNGLADLKKCLDSLHQKTNYPDYEVVIIDNQSEDPEALAFLRNEDAAGRLRILVYDKPFNHSAMNNLAVATCASEYVLLMNNDVELISENWLESLVGTIQLDDSIAGVGAKLLYPDGTIQHGGMILGIGGQAGHAHRFVADDDPGYLGRACLLNEFSGATAALLLLTKTAFEQVGGFDEREFPTSFNDTDLWIRLQRAGYRCLYNPFVKAYHYESKTRKTPRAEEAEYEHRLKSRWKSELENDRFYNPNLALDNEVFYHHRPFPRIVRYRRQTEILSLNLEKADIELVASDWEH